MLSLPRTQVQALVKELRPHKSRGEKKNNYGNLELLGTISPHGKSLPEIKPNPEEIKTKMWGVRDRKTPSHRKKRIWMTIFEL